MTKRVAIAVALAACFAARPVYTQNSAITAALADPDRPIPDRARDEVRKPGELLAFAGIKPGDKVIDFQPGNGFYTRLLAKVVGRNGHIYGFVPLIGPVPWSQAARDAAAKAGQPAPDNPIVPILSIQDTTAYGNVTAILANISGYGGTVPVPEQVDAVWMADAYHDFHSKAEALDMVAINKAILRALKPGGVYVVVDHAAAAGAGFSQTSTLHRAEAAAVRAEVEAAGFVFDGESTVLANAGDDKRRDALDPTLRDKTNQFALRFKKPANAPSGDKRRKDADLANYYGNTFLLGPTLRIMYHPDHTYQEFSSNSKALTSGTWYADADGHICLWHENVPRSRGFVACHPFEPFAISKRPGDAWTEYGADGAPWQVSLVKGLVYP